MCLRLCCISPSSSLIERSVFDDFGVFDESLLAFEDYDFWLRYCAYEKVLFVDERLIIKNVGLNPTRTGFYQLLKKQGATVGLANGILSADGKIIYTAENLKVGLFKG